MYTALVALFVTLALLGYGSKQETDALAREIAALEDQREALKAEIALLRSEWDHVTSAQFLLATAARLEIDAPLLGAEGAALTAWAPEQLLPLDRAPRRSHTHDDASGPLIVQSVGDGALRTATVGPPRLVDLNGG